MKRIAILAIVLVMLVGTGLVALAYNNPPSASTYTDGSAFYADEYLWMVSSGGAGGTCTPMVTSFIRWNVSSVSDTATLDSVNLRLTVRIADALGSQPVTLALYAVANDTWPESGSGAAPTVGNELATLTVDPATSTAGTVLTFSSPALTQYVQSQLADNLASFAIRITGCTSGAPELYLDSSRTANAPTLEIAEPTAVAMSSASAQQASAWPFYAGIGAVALLVVAGLTITRRRTA